MPREQLLDIKQSIRLRGGGRGGREVSQFATELLLIMMTSTGKILKYILIYQKNCFDTSVVTHTCNPGTQEAEMGR